MVVAGHPSLLLAFSLQESFLFFSVSLTLEPREIQHPHSLCSLQLEAHGHSSGQGNANGCLSGLKGKLCLFG